MTETIGKAERRRYQRYNLKLDAVLVSEASISFPSIILDFCSGGMFLEIPAVHKKNAAWLDQHVQVNFSTGNESKDQYCVSAQIVRVCASGVGVAFHAKPDAALAALQKLAKTDAQCSARDVYLAASLSPNKQKPLQESLLAILEEHLPQISSDFFRHIDDTLNRASETAESFADQNACEKAGSSLKLARKSIGDSFDKAMLLECQAIFDTVTKNDAVSVDDGSMPLALIDKDDFEDWLNLSAVIKNLETRYETQLHILEKKLHHLINSPLQISINPVSPEKICDSFRAAIFDVTDNNHLRSIFYRAFETTLCTHLDNLYRQFDQALTGHGAPQFITPRPEQPGKTARPRRPADASANATETEEPQSSPPEDNILPFRQTTAQPHAQQSVVQTVGNLLTLNEQSSAIASATNPVNYPLAQEHDHTATHSQNAYSRKEIATALSQLQIIQPAIHEHWDAKNLQQQFLGTLENLSGSNKTLSVNDANTLQVYARLFETLLKDVTLSTGFREFLQKIHVPLLAQTMLDSGFLNKENHPARNVLNQLEAVEGEIVASHGVQNQKIRATVDRLTSRIVQEAGDNPAIFTEVDQQLKAITAPADKVRAANINRVIAICEGKQALAEARQKIQSEIDQRIAGRSIPTIVQKLLLAGWQHLLVLGELNNDQPPADQQRKLVIIDQLLSWFDNQNFLGAAHSNAIHEALDFIDSELTTVCANSFVHDQIIEELSACLLGTGQPPARKAVTMIDIAPQKPHDEEHDSITGDIWSELVAQLKVGDWMEFSFGRQDPEPLKLIWIGKTPELFVFVNRKGEKRLELNPETLAEKMHCGSARRTESLDVPLMDRATHSMLEKMHEKLVYNATHDPITKLANRKEFVRQFQREISSLKGTQHILCYIEIQNFRIITNTCGLDAGDKLLRRFADYVQSRLIDEQLFARIGDKTFAMLLQHCSSEKGYEIIKTLRDQINHCHFEWQDKSYPIAVSTGIVPFSGSDCHIDKIMIKADAACLSAKRAGHNHIQIYEQGNQRLQEQNHIHNWAGQIDKVLSENRLFARCQMIAPVDPQKNQHTHYEILLGIRDRHGGIIAPDDFIPAVEHNQRMPEVDRWVIQTVFSWIAQNHSLFETFGGFSINLSGQSFNTEDFLDFLIQSLDSAAFAVEKITFEITETVAADSLVHVENFISEIKRFGCKFSLDDFGTGYSSYSYLKNLNVDYLKIDGAFIKDILNSSTDAAMVKSMNEIAHSLGLETIAEYVENRQIQELLKEIGVDYAQGWGIAKPGLLEDLGKA